MNAEDQVEPDHRSKQILALAADKRALEAQIAALREALKDMRAFIAPDMEDLARAPLVRKALSVIDVALAATEPKEGQK